jgi:hypothetical protein
LKWTSYLNLSPFFLFFFFPPFFFGKKKSIQLVCSFLMCIELVLQIQQVIS